MRITIELDESQLKSVLRATGKTKMSPAVSAALDEYLAMKRRARRIIKPRMSPWKHWRIPRKNDSDRHVGLD
jgi:Arc/MetJ family transcription regulator